MTATVGGTAAPADQVVQAGERRVARVESLRALAALAVALGHAWGYAHAFGPGSRQTLGGRLLYGGGVGVFLFFALSGYLLFWPFAKRYFGGGAPINLRRYAMNRVLRILPLYWAVVILLLLTQEHGGTGEQWWRFMLLAENFSHRTIATVDGVLWSLVVEVHFYILLPFLAAAIGRVARGRRLPAAGVLLGLGAISFALWQVKVHAPAFADPLWRYNLPATFFYFVPGMLIAILRLAWEERSPRVLNGLLGASTAWLLVSAALWLVIFDHVDRASLSAVAAFLTVGACVLPLRDGAARRLLDWRPLAALGVASYSLYVWHTRLQEHLVARHGFPTAGWAVIAITIPLAILVAFVSYRVIEEPFLRLRRRWSTASAPIGADATTRVDLPAAAKAAP
jgi:peptidoglycan/LPS O-acetylase OafA/YrhL